MTSSLSTRDTTVVSVRMPEKLKERFWRIADADRRPISNMILIALEEWLENRERSKR